MNLLKVTQIFGPRVEIGQLPRVCILEPAGSSAMVLSLDYFFFAALILAQRAR